MFRCLPDFENCFNYVYEQNSSEGIFIFHGFPSQKNRNKDLAFNLFQTTTASIFVHHYEGLGESLGRFYFKNSLEQAHRFVDHISKTFDLKTIHFLGHSWGGFVSLNLMSFYANQLGSVVLYSPFTQIPQGKGVDQLADNLMNEYPHLFFHRSRPDVIREFTGLQSTHSYRESLEKLKWQKPVLVLQAKNDTSTPEEQTKAVLPLLGSFVSYQELEIDHSFTQKREDTFKLTHQFYRKIHLLK